MAHRRLPVRAGGPKRQVTWIGPADQPYVAVASTVSVLLASFDPNAAGLAKPTVVRTRGQVSVKPEAFTGDVDIVGAFGMCVVTDQAFGIGITAIPDPFDQAEWDGWFVWRSFSYHLEFSTAENILLGSWDFEVDSKAMRKVGDNETIVLMAQSQIGAFRISAPVRLLLKLS